MKKSIDVLFICPKNHCLVVWHQTSWWQVARMDLTEVSWQRRKAYTGSLEDIFVAKQQVSDIKTLDLVALPEKLWGVTATKFLGWWQLNRYQFWHTHQDGVSTNHLDNSISLGNTIISDVVTAQDKTAGQDKITTDDVLNPPSTVQLSNTNGASQIATTVSNSSDETLSGDDIFEALMRDLTQDIRRAHNSSHNTI